MENLVNFFLNPVNAAYHIDVAIVIDATDSMAPMLDVVKRNTLTFADRIRQMMRESGRDVGQLRVRVIAFRDYGCTDAPAMETSEFFSLPEQNEAFRDWVSGIEATGGGDEPESALEALALAMRSDWTTAGVRRRHMILVFTDAPAVFLGDPRRTCHPDYPANMPGNMEELTQMWAGENPALGGMPDINRARLIICAPDAFPWREMSSSWENTLQCFSDAGRGLSEFDFDTAFQVLVNC